MALVILILFLRIYLFFTFFVMIFYTIRHFIFSVNRTIGEQKLYYQDILDSDLPSVTVIIPMHNEEKVAKHSMENVLKTDYPKHILEIIPVNDHSDDRTKEILDDFAARYPQIKPFHRESGKRGKPSALNDVMEFAKGDIIIVFDADYLPPRGIIRDIALSFKDPEVGAVMGRVIPQNVGSNLLTRLLDLERTGGYQVDQQARYNMRLIPQYGGTVGGFRKIVAQSLDGFDPRIITEDTELTFKLYERGWKVVYANRAECYEEAPEDWSVRSRQVMRWARGHTQVFFRFWISLFKSKYLTFKEKLDGILLLSVYLIPLLLLFGMINAVALFFLGEMNIYDSVVLFLMIAFYSSFGNAAPFFQIGAGALLDGGRQRIRLLPILMFNFVFYMWYISKGSFLAIFDVIRGASPEWQKTERYRKEEDEEVK
jgi:cellulose synthase/poly-beta-1,6-N-acetylglucosamine synthase-like glycosyltransferase